ncbi:helix-turn-helix domain-containing protein [Rhodococcus cerastii]|nr:helix-turn-helix domain-containing protein [Rhodococcus cerastii]
MAAQGMAQLAEILTTAQVEEMTGIPAGTLRYWRATNQGPASFALTAKKIVYRRSELEKWIATREAASTRGGVA